MFPKTGERPEDEEAAGRAQRGRALVEEEAAEETDEEKTEEITGADAPPEEAEIGSAGSGAAPFGADLSGGPVRPLLEEDPSDVQDITPDRIERSKEAPPEKEVTAQPTEPKPEDPSRWP